MTKKIILLVEDDPDILDIMCYMLTDTGYDVLRSTGGDAVLLAENHKPDLVILDHRLHAIWGADICRELKRNDRTANIPVMIVSAMMQLEDIAKNAGADWVLEKPFGMKQLLDLVAFVV